MKELIELIVLGIRLKPQDFNRSLHAQISPFQIRYRKAQRIFRQAVGISVAEMKKVALAFAKLGRTMQVAAKPLDELYVMGLRAERKLYEECINSPQWR